MKSSSGAYFVGLDHLRGLAAFMVFTWHFLHGANGSPVPFGSAPALIPLAIFDEGHCGVSLFMTLSGYLFAKLLDGNRLQFGWFLWNRLLRLCPLLIFTLALQLVIAVHTGGDVAGLLRFIESGALFPTLPGGAWSITVEMHFYLVLPLILIAFRRTMVWAVALLVLSVGLRAYLYLCFGEIQFLAYWTLVGRIDQFVLGIVFFMNRHRITPRHSVALIAMFMYSGFYFWFDQAGGFYHLSGYPSMHPIWIVMPTIEGAFFALMITYYDNAVKVVTCGILGFLARIGDYSYSIYLLHFFFVFAAAQYIDEHVISLRNFYVALFASAFSFLLFLPVAGLSYHLLEKPPLRFRRKYIRTKPYSASSMLIAPVH